MEFFVLNIGAMLAGLVLDFLIGDPEGWPHPVIWMGKYISWMEKKLRARGGNLRRGAVFLTLSTVLFSMAACFFILWAASLLGRWALFMAMAILSWTALSARCLAKEAKGVAGALSQSLPKGRTQVARIVGRDTSELSRSEIVKATIETVAENTTDGVISPMLYLALGGPVLAMGFKAASTLDSMVGYLDEKYRDIGWFSARLDDAFNFLPARLAGPLMALCAFPLFPLGLKGGRAWAVLVRDHKNHLSPNCAWTESAAAGALGIQLGGSHRYFGKVVVKPAIGDALRPAQPRDIFRMNALMLLTSLLALALILLAGGLACRMA